MQGDQRAQVLPASECLLPLRAERSDISRGEKLLHLIFAVSPVAPPHSLHHEATLVNHVL